MNRHAVEVTSHINCGLYHLAGSCERAQKHSNISTRSVPWAMQNDNKNVVIKVSVMTSISVYHRNVIKWQILQIRKN